MDDPVLFAIEEKVAVITLNRPERRNAINQALLVQLCRREYGSDR
jgi:enoyl-CoA hydratase